MKVIANWKMNLPTPDIRSWTENFYSNVNLDDSKTIGVAPPFTHISSCVTYLQNLRVGAQNISSRDQEIIQVRYQQALQRTPVLILLF